jgi:hypothetical protein
LVVDLDGWKNRELDLESQQKVQEYPIENPQIPENQIFQNQDPLENQWQEIQSQPEWNSNEPEEDDISSSSQFENFDEKYWKNQEFSKENPGRKSYGSFEGQKVDTPNFEPEFPRNNYKIQPGWGQRKINKIRYNPYQARGYQHKLRGRGPVDYRTKYQKAGQPFTQYESFMDHTFQANPRISSPGIHNAQISRISQYNPALHQSQNWNQQNLRRVPYGSGGEYPIRAENSVLQMPRNYGKAGEELQSNDELFKNVDETSLDEQEYLDYPDDYSQDTEQLSDKWPSVISKQPRPNHPVIQPRAIDQHRIYADRHLKTTDKLDLIHSLTTNEKMDEKLHEAEKIFDPTVVVVQHGTSTRVKRDVGLQSVGTTYSIYKMNSPFHQLKITLQLFRRDSDSWTEISPEIP